jgi:hypothetical protein
LPLPEELDHVVHDVGTITAVEKRLLKLLQVDPKEEAADIGLEDVGARTT